MRIAQDQQHDEVLVTMELPIKGAPMTTSGYSHALVNPKQVFAWYVTEPNVSWKFNKGTQLPELVEGTSRRRLPDEDPLPCVLDLDLINENISSHNMHNQGVPIIVDSPVIKNYYLEIVDRLNEVIPLEPDNLVMSIEFDVLTRKGQAELQLLVHKCLTIINLLTEALGSLVDDQEADEYVDPEVQEQIVGDLEAVGSLYALYRMELKFLELDK